MEAEQSRIPFDSNNSPKFSDGGDPPSPKRADIHQPKSQDRYQPRFQEGPGSEKKPNFQSHM